MTAYRINELLSEEYEIPNGTPQGSPLSPILSILFSSDILPFVRRYIRRKSKYAAPSKINVLHDLFMFIDDGLFVISTRSWDSMVKLASDTLEGLHKWACTFSIQVN